MHSLYGWPGKIVNTGTGSASAVRYDLTPGTLWEHMSPNASCNHGFASCAVCLLDALEKKGLLNT